MGKGFSRLSKAVLAGGLLISMVMGILSFRDRELFNGQELVRNDFSQDFYEEKLTAFVGKEKIPMTVKVSPRKLSKKEAEEELEKAKNCLDELLKGENESLSSVVTDLNFAEQVEGTLVFVEWTEKLPEYFHADGSIREDVTMKEPVEQVVGAVLTCQEISIDYKAKITLMPRIKSTQTGLQDAVEQIDSQTIEESVLQLPIEYEGEAVIWKKQLDPAFLSFAAMMIAAAAFLNAGEKYDQKTQRKNRLEAMEREYAAVVSKFTMLLSAGLSVRNAWERIVRMDKGKLQEDHPIFAEMKWALLEMQKGISEVEIYEAFGRRVGEIHYKKLMALFVSQKKRGSIQLIDAMNEEMMVAWEEQKRKMRQQGEKIGTKLLVPMMGMLAVVFVMILVPAFLSF